MRKAKKTERRTIEFKIMLTPSEREWIEAKAKELNITMTEFVKHHYIK
jgi:hypothetical protein